MPAPSLIPALKIEQPYDSATRWLIPSKSEGGAAYLVDLAENEGWGSCQCMWCQTSYAPLLKKGVVPIRTCSHITDARKKFALWAVNAFDKQDKNNREQD